jgi:hypothetical protein
MRRIILISIICALLPFSANAAVSLTLSDPVSDEDKIQQTSQTPSIFAGAVPTQPAGFGWEQLPGGGRLQTYDAFTGSMAVNWENTVTGNSGDVSGEDYTVDQIKSALGGISVFDIGIDSNSNNAGSEVLELFEVLIDRGMGFEVEFSFNTPTSIAPINNGTGFSDYLLSSVDLSGFDDSDLVKFHVVISGAVAGQEQFFLTAASAPVPVPAAVWLFGSAIAGMVGWSRRRTG